MRSAFRLPERLARLSLRTRLLLLLVALAAVGLATADFVSYRALHNYLYDRVDQQLESAVGPVSGFLTAKAGQGEALPGLPGGRAGSGSAERSGEAGAGGGERSREPGTAGAERSGERGIDSGDQGGEAGAGGAGAGTGVGLGEGTGGAGGPGGPGPQGGELPGSAYGQLRAADGAVLAHTNAGFYGEEVPTPKLPANLAATSFDAISPVTVGESGGGSERFRAAAVRITGTSLTAVVAVPLGDTDATLSHLALIELVVSAVILAALAAAAWWLVGVGLRPLRRMGEVAGQIAAGDLSRRVEPDDERTEVGRLGRSLNAMLGQIEAAFAERAAGEMRLRRFLADASHELRTPLASIRGYSELYRIGAAREPAEVERAMSRIEAESARMGGLVDDLLTLARVDEVREPAREPLDLRELLEDARDDARAAAPEREITLTESGPVATMADGDALRRVFANLLRNAVVHTPDGTPIELGLSVGGAGARAGSEGTPRSRASKATPVSAAMSGSGAMPGSRATITVRDHGPGLPPGDPNAVFERFWRDSSSRGRDDGGAGLGLAIVAAIVSAHGGTVEATNPAGSGALFTVHLPLH